MAVRYHKGPWTFTYGQSQFTNTGEIFSGDQKLCDVSMVTFRTNPDAALANLTLMAAGAEMHSALREGMILLQQFITSAGSYPEVSEDRAVLGRMEKALKKGQYKNNLNNLND